MKQATNRIVDTNNHEDQIREFLLGKLQKERDGVTLKNLIEAAEQEGSYSEDDVRIILRMLEQIGKVNAGWDWKYRIQPARK